MASTLVADGLEPRASVERFSTHELGPTLERFQSSGLLEEGRINLICLDAIADRLGDKWEGRQEQIYHHVERTLTRHLEGGGFFQRVSATDYLVVQPTLGKFSAQVSCLLYLRELLNHFLGGAAPEAADVLEVTSLSSGRIFAAEIDRDHAALAARTEPPPAPPEEDDSLPTPWNPFVAADGRTLRVSCHLEPVFELKTFAQIGYRIARRVLRMPEAVELTPQELRNLTTADIEKVDLATIARGVSRLKSEQGNARQPTLFLPVSYTTLASQRGRGPLIARFKEATRGVDKGLVCEITDIEGVPGSALAAVTVMIKPFCMIVVGKLREAPGRSPEDLRGVRLQGVAFEAGAHPLERGEFTAWAEHAIANARRVTRSVILHGLSGPEYLGLAGLAGATHGSLAARRAPPASV
ncbi:MAG: hypothetical protein KKC29_03185 [Alphaproteobacteria bacterium]|jgi:hypothetical protein|nr:hypothetical protein [Alphaproteobacteria bacterium]MBU2041573.1 hypothetical protein [Alphaproteobacteria bacterium]MBU2125780.1 hypothetical protein [Alphaproteobacteria bacterium]MBU2290088.1 hypothetical protein [Alphaproteobacteria bacterium]MBU2398634.1 hypothetical protein [Alphaproteobacteria bacterium]